jgi:ABC-2 type transport system ATP-binding protein
MAVIQVSSLRKSYNPIVAVDGISFEVQDGEIFSLLGPNGAGKTTTIEILEGLREKDEGDVKVLGLDPWKDGYSLHKRIGVMPQGFKFFDKETPKEAIKYYAELFGVRVDADKILNEVILSDASNVWFENLSGGQKQKTGLALSLVNNPDLLFLDEPTTGLDPQARRAVWDVIRLLKREGRAILLTTHYLEEAELLADRVAIMNRGKIIAEGTPLEIIKEFGSGERLQVKADRALSEYLKQKTGLEVDYDSAKGVVNIFLKEKSDAFKAMEAIDRSGIAWSDLSTKRDSLEDIFVKLVGGKIEEEGDIVRKYTANQKNSNTQRHQ